MLSIHPCKNLGIFIAERNGCPFGGRRMQKVFQDSLPFKVEKDWSRYAIKDRNTPPFPNPPLAHRTMPPAPQQQGDA